MKKKQTFIDIYAADVTRKNTSSSDCHHIDDYCILIIIVVSALSYPRYCLTTDSYFTGVPHKQLKQILQMKQHSLELLTFFLGLQQAHSKTKRPNKLEMGGGGLRLQLNALK